MKNYSILIIISVLFSCNTSNKKNNISEKTEKQIGTLEIVTEMDVNPGNVAVSKEGRVFTSIHPLRATDLQLVEITGKTNYIAFPNKDVQSTLETKSEDKLDTPLGIIFDNKNRLWVIDVGLNIGKTRLFAYDINTKKQLYRYDIPKELAPKNSFVQDLAIDENNNFVYLADFGNPGIIAVDVTNNTSRKITHLPTMQSEDIDIVIDGNKQYFMGSPARIGINPITLSADRNTLYYGAMNGTKWYQLPTDSIRNGKKLEDIIQQITITGVKPISDGVATDDKGNHYFTNIQNHSIDILSNDGQLSTLKKDILFDWADNVRIHKNWLYISVNQLHKSTAFTGNQDVSKTPYRILRLKYR